MIPSATSPSKIVPVEANSQRKNSETHKISDSTNSSNFLPNDFWADRFLQLFYVNGKADVNFRLKGNHPLLSMTTAQIQRLRDSIPKTFEFVVGETKIVIQSRVLFNSVKSSWYLCGSHLRKHILDEDWYIENLRTILDKDEVFKELPRNMPITNLKDIDLYTKLDPDSDPSEIAEQVIARLAASVRKKDKTLENAIRSNFSKYHALFHINEQGEKDTNAFILSFNNVDYVLTETNNQAALVTIQDLNLKLDLFLSTASEPDLQKYMLPEGKEHLGMQAILDHLGKISHTCSDNYLALFKVISLSTEMFRHPVPIRPLIFDNLNKYCSRPENKKEALLNLAIRQLKQSENSTKRFAFAFNLCACLQDHAFSVPEIDLLWERLKACFNQNELPYHLNLISDAISLVSFDVVRAAIEVFQCLALSQVAGHRDRQLYLTRHDGKPAYLSFHENSTLIYTAQFVTSLKLLKTFVESSLAHDNKEKLDAISTLLKRCFTKFEYAFEVQSTIAHHFAFLDLDLKVVQSLAEYFLSCSNTELKLLGFRLLFFCHELSPSKDLLETLLIYSYFAYFHERQTNIINFLVKKQYNKKLFVFFNETYSARTFQQWLARLISINKHLYSSVSEVCIRFYQGEKVEIDYAAFSSIIQSIGPCNYEKALQIFLHYVKRASFTCEDEFNCFDKTIDILLINSKGNSFKIIEIFKLLNKKLELKGRLEDFYRKNLPRWLDQKWDAMGILFQATIDDILPASSKRTCLLWVVCCSKIYQASGFDETYKWWRKGSELGLWQVGCDINKELSDFLISFIKSLYKKGQYSEGLLGHEALELIAHQNFNREAINELHRESEGKKEVEQKAFKKIIIEKRELETELKKKQVDVNACRLKAKKIFENLINYLDDRKKVHESLTYLRQLFMNPKVIELWKENEHHLEEKIIQCLKNSEKPQIINLHSSLLLDIFECGIHLMSSSKKSSNSLIKLLIKWCGSEERFIVNTKLKKAIAIAIPRLLDTYKRDNQPYEVVETIYDVIKNNNVLDSFPASLLVSYFFWAIESIPFFQSNKNEDQSIHRKIDHIIEQVRLKVDSRIDELLSKTIKNASKCVTNKNVERATLWLSLFFQLSKLNYKPTNLEDCLSLVDLSVKLFEHGKSSLTTSILETFSGQSPTVLVSVSEELTKLPTYFYTLNPEFFARIFIANKLNSTPSDEVIDKVHFLAKELLRAPSFGINLAIELAGIYGTPTNKVLVTVLKSASKHRYNKEQQINLWKIFVEKRSINFDEAISKLKMAYYWIKCWKAGMRILCNISESDCSYLRFLEEEIQNILNGSSVLKIVNGEATKGISSEFLNKFLFKSLKVVKRPDLHKNLMAKICKLNRLFPLSSQGQLLLVNRLLQMSRDIYFFEAIMYLDHHMSTSPKETKELKEVLVALFNDSRSKNPFYENQFRKIIHFIKNKKSLVKFILRTHPKHPLLAPPEAFFDKETKKVAKQVLLLMFVALAIIIIVQLLFGDISAEELVYIAPPSDPIHRYHKKPPQFKRILPK